MPKNIEFRLQFIDLYKKGYHNCEIARKLHKSDRTIGNLKAEYLAIGEDEFLRDKAGRVIVGKLKQQVVAEYLEKNVSLTSLSFKYNVSIISIKRWTRKAKETGLDTLTTSTYGKPKDMAKKPERISPEVLEENRRLKEELEYLRTENAYLKKLRALVEEERANFIKEALGSSKD